MPNYSTKRTIIGQIKKGADLYNSITRIVQENGIRMGRVTGMARFSVLRSPITTRKQ